MTYFEDTQEDLDRWNAQDEQEEQAVREEWQNDRAEQADRFVDESNVDRPDDMIVSATNGHVWHVSPPRHAEWL